MSKKPYTFGQVFINPYLGNKTTEVLSQKKRVGWLWTHTDGRVIVSPYLGFYIWFNENAERWTTESGAMWLVTKSKNLPS